MTSGFPLTSSIKSSVCLILSTKVPRSPTILLFAKSRDIRSKGRAACSSPMSSSSKFSSRSRTRIDAGTSQPPKSVILLLGRESTTRFVRLERGPRVPLKLLCPTRTNEISVRFSRPSSPPERFWPSKLRVRNSDMPRTKDKFPDSVPWKSGPLPSRISASSSVRLASAATSPRTKFCPAFKCVSCLRLPKLAMLPLRELLARERSCNCVKDCSGSTLPVSELLSICRKLSGMPRRGSRVPVMLLKSRSR